MKTYPDIEAFYAERGGANSGECDFGAWWHEGAGYPRFRLSVVHDTGDVYALTHGTGEVRLLATLPVGGGCSGMNHSPDCAYEVAERLLAGWADQPARPLAWAMERLPAQT